MNFFSMVFPPVLKGLYTDDRRMIQELLEILFDAAQPWPLALYKLSMVIASDNS